MRVLLTGGNGMLGFAIARSRPGPVELVCTDAPDLDVTGLDAVRAGLARHRPDAVLHAAAFTNVDLCESQEERATLVNGAGSGHVARACAEADVPLLAVSTDYVFDGRLPAPGEYSEEDRTGPLSAYGRSKLAGELAVRAAHDRHWIVRTQWLYGLRGPNFVETMLRLGTSQPFLEVVDDQVGSPTCTHDLAPVLWRILLEQPAFGTYHAASRGSCSWHGFAGEIFRAAGVAVDLRPTDSRRFERPAPRPARGVLGCAKLREALGAALPTWQDALSGYLRLRAAHLDLVPAGATVHGKS